MLNVYSESKIASFVEAGLKNEEDMENYCLQRVEVARITKQRAVTALQKWLNSLFLGPLGCKAEFRGTRDLLIIIALRLSIDVWFFGAAHMGFSQDFTQDGAASILDRWKKEDGSRKYKRLCPDDSKDSRFYPCKLKTTVKRWRCWFRTSFGWMEDIRTRRERDTIHCEQATCPLPALDRLAPSIRS
jgi:hypothetical protein